MARSRPGASSLAARGASSSSHHGRLGYSLVELVFVLGLMAMMSAVAVAGVLTAIDDSRAIAAVRYLSSKLQRARMEAVMRSCSTGLRFVSGAGGYAYGMYLDGNGNGVRTADIGRGVDRELMPPERLPDLFRGVDFGVIPDLPPVEPGTPPPGSDPIKTGSSDILSFSSIGTATSGSLYIRGSHGAQYVIRVLGDTARTRVLRFDSRARRWGPL